LNRPTWDQRINRAQDLAAAYPFAAEVLGFYEQLAARQKELHAAFRSALEKNAPPVPPGKAGNLRAVFDGKLLMAHYPRFLRFVAEAAPAALADTAAQLEAAGGTRWEQLLASSWSRLPAGDEAESVMAPRAADDPEERRAHRPALHRFLALAYLQPYAECLAESMGPAPATANATCPLCASPPVLAMLRPQGHGTRRSLLCALCGTEWDFNRVVCVACGETRADSLAVYTSEQFDHIRVDACDTCKRYVKTVDLSKNGLAVAVVDEMAALPLALWAQENGYSKLVPNLLGM
jgi:formate dehydrogenase accessory protein FdhE